MRQQSIGTANFVVFSMAEPGSKVWSKKRRKIYTGTSTLAGFEISILCTKHEDTGRKSNFIQ